jgi:hypothetical protein
MHTQLYETRDILFYIFLCDDDEKKRGNKKVLYVGKHQRKKVL